MRYHKIRNVPMEVCTAEQKIAYNLAFRASISYQEAYNEAKIISAVCVSEILRQIVAISMENYRSAYNYKQGKYDEDAIFSALNAGLSAYLDHPFIASDYETIGKAFPALYLKA